MACKVDHADPLSVPKALCRVCHPELVTKTAPLEVATPSTDAQAERFEKRQRRKLKAEAKRLQTEIDKIAGRNPAATMKIQAALDEVNRDLYIVS